MDTICSDLPCHQDKRFIVSNSVFYSPRNSPSESIQLAERSSPRKFPAGAESPQEAESPCDAEEAVTYDSYSFDDYEIINSNDESLSVSCCGLQVRVELSMRLFFNEC